MVAVEEELSTCLDCDSAKGQVPYAYLTVTREQAERLRQNGRAFEGILSDNGARTIRISAADRPRAEQVLALNAAGAGIKK